MEKITWKKTDNYLEAFGTRIECSCVVRNELNGWRPSASKSGPDEVVRSIPGSVPCMPRTFPEGKWLVSEPRKRTDKYRAPYFIPTNAHHKIDEWSLKPDGSYDKKTGNKILSNEYGLHFSTSGTTLGCIKIHKKSDLLFLVAQINKKLKEGIDVYMEVSC